MQKGEPRRTMVLCIDSYTDGVPGGRFYNLFHKESHSFQSLTQLLILMEKKLDEANFPQAFDSLRTFGTPELPVPADSPDGEGTAAGHGKLANFTVRILFRQNASWQGSIHWLEGDEEERFRSVLEMIFLMDSALSRRRNLPVRVP